PPFPGDNLLDVLQAVVHNEPARPQSVNAAANTDLSVIALKCLAKEPGGRYESAAALADDLERYLRGDPIPPRPPTTLQRRAQSGGGGGDGGHLRGADCRRDGVVAVRGGGVASGGPVQGGNAEGGRCARRGGGDPYRRAAAADRASRRRVARPPGAGRAHEAD